MSPLSSRLQSAPNFFPTPLPPAQDCELQCIILPLQLCAFKRPDIAAVHHGSLQDQQDHHPAGDRLGVLLTGTYYRYLPMHPKSLRLETTVELLLTRDFPGYTVHSLALVADSFHMVQLLPPETVTVGS